MTSFTCIKYRYFIRVPVFYTAGILYRGIRLNFANPVEIQNTFVVTSAYTKLQAKLRFTPIDSDMLR